MKKEGNYVIISVRMGAMMDMMDRAVTQWAGCGGNTDLNTGVIKTRPFIQLNYNYNKTIKKTV